MAGAAIHQINVSRGGVPKLPVDEARVEALGLDGDVHLNLVHHGGPDRAVSLWALERIQALAAEGHPIAAGSAGENVTTQGLDWALVVPGARLRLGADVVLEITRYAPPCRQNARWFRDGDFTRISQKTHPGWSRAYARVVAGGVIRPGDEIVVLGRQAPAEG